MLGSKTSSEKDELSFTFCLNYRPLASYTAVNSCGITDYRSPAGSYSYEFFMIWVIIGQFTVKRT